VPASKQSQTYPYKLTIFLFIIILFIFLHMNWQINSLLQEAIQNFKRNNFVEAKILLLKVLDIEPQNFDALNIIGVINGIESNHIEAINFFKKAQKIRPDNNFINFNLAKAFSKVGNDLEAIKYYEIAIRLKPDYAEAYNNKGNIFFNRRRYDEALSDYEQAIKLKPDFTEVYNNKGNTFFNLRRYDEALSHYEQAIKLKPDFAEAYNDKGNLLIELKRYEEVLFNYDQALKLKPDYEYLFGMLLFIKNFICDWSDFEANVKSLILKIKENKKCSPNFPVLIFSDSLLIQRKNCEIFINDKNPLNLSLGLISKYQRRNKIRIGYYSADFHNHATSYLMAELFERHDKTKFELIAFSFGPYHKDEMRHRISNAFTQFIDVRFKSDKDIALMSREMGIDIAIDLKGFTENERTGIFSYRAAPIQVNYIGYPGTMAAEYIDYIIADQTIIPIESRKHYYEKVVYLPNSYQVNDRNRIIADRVFTREELGLPKKGFVFCCFNNNFKITPCTFDGWIRILKAVEGSVLWLIEDNIIARINLRKEAEKRGLNSIRLVFAKRMKLPEHLARHCAADLFIDTFPYTAHTTASDALWAGLPVLTCTGESFASRVAASLLNAIELYELIATTQEQYESIAIDLANNPEKLKAIKNKLESNKLTTALFDTPRFTKYIESAYMQMYERYQDNLPPDDIYIKN